MQHHSIVGFKVANTSLWSCHWFTCWQPRWRLLSCSWHVFLLLCNDNSCMCLRHDHMHQTPKPNNITQLHYSPWMHHLCGQQDTSCVAISYNSLEPNFKLIFKDIFPSFSQAFRTNRFPGFFQIDVCRIRALQKVRLPRFDIESTKEDKKRVFWIIQAILLINSCCSKLVQSLRLYLCTNTISCAIVNLTQTSR